MLSIIHVSNSLYQSHALSLCTQLHRKSQCLLNLFKKMIEPIAGYFLKICIFQSAALRGRCAQCFVGNLSRIIFNFWTWTQGVKTKKEPFLPERLARSNAFLAQFAAVHTLRTADGAQISFALYHSEAFQRWLAANGGVREGEWIRPRREEDWNTLQALRTFKYFEEEGHAFRAPLATPHASEQCILRCQLFGKKMGMDKSMIALHLAAGFNFAIFDWREEPSIRGFFFDAEAAYQAVCQAGFQPNQIKALGSCRATFAVARLKELHHVEGMDAVMIHRSAPQSHTKSGPPIASV